MLISVQLFGQIEGFYVRAGTVYAMTYETFCFKGSRFELMWESDLAKISCSGSFIIKNDTLILNSDKKLQDLIQVRTHSLKKLDSTYISVSTFSKEPPIFTTIKINNDTTEYKLPNYEFKNLIFPKGKIKTLSVDSYLLYWRTSDIKFEIPKETTFIEIILDDTQGLSNAYFDNEKFLIKGNRIMRIEASYDFFYIKSENAECK
jgi:hypothetical protein